MPDFTQQDLSLYTGRGERKYVNQAERQRVLAVMEKLARERALFSLVLAWTGGRVSEVLAVRASSFQIERNVVALRTLKRRKPHVREIPIASGLMAAIDNHFGLKELQQNPDTANRRLWPWSRFTAWRVVKGAMLEAGIVGRSACPRGLRHGFGIGTLQASVPLNMVQKWMGHARISTTAIYADACGPEEIAFAEKFWLAAPEDGDPLGPRPPSGQKRFCRWRRSKRLYGLAKRLTDTAAMALLLIAGVAAGLLVVELTAHM